MLYKFAWWLGGVFLRVFYGLRITGREHIPQGALIFFANHTKATDPVIIACTIPKAMRLCIMGKAELFRFAPLAMLLRYCGAYPIERGAGDMGAIKKTLEMLKLGRKVIIFPDGHRSDEENPDNAKNGMALLAVKSGAPVLPIYLTPNRRFLRRNLRVIFGKPFNVVLPDGMPRSEAYRQVTQELVREMYAMGADADGR
ncbi:MAG: 1-acyl-sn-glycerol-3-phosphate acyltransferase [Oscillospiraceae bacterium]|jgi:1-acyl-sn-glycerol-3-phosphate acyltransferase|nr:1-acyl-sn-glycerol-3-phosphate acyltransferase [Oscillospiraceae bacterium]